MAYTVRLTDTATRVKAQTFARTVSITIPSELFPQLIEVLTRSDFPATPSYLLIEADNRGDVMLERRTIGRTGA